MSGRKSVYDDGTSGRLFPLGGEDGSRAHVWAWERKPNDRDAEVWARIESGRGLDVGFFGSAEGMRRLGEHLIAAAHAVEKSGLPEAWAGPSGDETRVEPPEALALDLERIAADIVATAERRRAEWARAHVGGHPIQRALDLADQARALAHELAPDLVARSGS